jgi:cytoskeletal protein CcmA (bactofilin family)
VKRLNNKSVAVIAVMLLMMLACFTLPVEAATVLTGDNMTVKAGEIIDDDLYLFGQTVTVSGVVTGDAILFGSEVIVDGQIMGSLLVFAQNVRIDGNVAGSVRGGSNTFSFHGSTGRDLMIMANTVTVAGPVGQDFFAAANNAMITGSVARDIKTSMNRLVVDGPVGGDIEANVSELVIGPRALVDGKVTYTSESDATVNNQAVVRGALTRLDPPASEVTSGKPAGFSFWGFVRPILSLLVVGLVMILLFPEVTKGAAGMIRSKPGGSLGTGALIVFVAPIAAVILLVTVIGIPISFLSMLLYIVLLYLSRIFAGYFLASLAFEKLGKELHPVWVTLIGVLVLALIFRIPYVGWLVHLAAVLFGSGAFMHYMLNKKNEPEQVPVRTETETA